jgi:hypothetical protein
MWWIVVQIGLVLAAVGIAVCIVWKLIERTQDAVNEIRRRMGWTEVARHPGPYPQSPDAPPPTFGIAVSSGYATPLYSPRPSGSTGQVDDNTPRGAVDEGRPTQNAPAEAQTRSSHPWEDHSRITSINSWDTNPPDEWVSCGCAGGAVGEIPGIGIVPCPACGGTCRVRRTR